MAFERPHGYSDRAASAARRLRHDLSASEGRLWDAMRALKLRVRRQSPIGPYVADFVCQPAKLIVEVDGGVHALPQVQARDADRDAWFEARGYVVMRVSSEEAYGRPNDVAHKVADKITTLLPRREKGRVEGVHAPDEADGAIGRRRPSTRSVPDSLRSPSSPTLLPSREKGAEIRRVLNTIPDPEVPAVTIVDLGMVRDVADDAVTITPTYTGCPATLAIQQSVRIALDQAGFHDVAVKTTIDPPWTTDWITDEGRAKLNAYGIAPPSASPTAACPQCGSTHTEEVSRFGSTPCKALWKCLDCAEPFDRFKCH